MPKIQLNDIELYYEIEGAGEPVLFLHGLGSSSVAWQFQKERFAAEYQISYPLFLSGNRSAMYNAAFDNPSGSLPYTALLSRDQNIVFQHNGELTAQQLRAQLDALLQVDENSKL